jgi:hypothetical protein
VAASWTFYASFEPPFYSHIKPYFTVDGDGLRLHPIPKPLTRDLIASHHAHDYYMHEVWTRSKFPYALQVAHAGYVRVARAEEYRLLSDAYWGVSHPSGSGVLARRLVDRMARTAWQRNRLAVVMLPHVDRLLLASPFYDEFSDDLGKRGDICVIETKPVLREQGRAGGLDSLRAPNRHYNAFGNKLIAEVVATGLQQCDISPRSE